VRKGVIAPLPGTHRYVLSADGRRLSLLFTVTYGRIAIPALGQLRDPEAATPLARKWRAVTSGLDPSSRPPPWLPETRLIRLHIGPASGLLSVLWHAISVCV